MTSIHKFTPGNKANISKYLKALQYAQQTQGLQSTLIHQCNFCISPINNIEDKKKITSESYNNPNISAKMRQSQIISTTQVGQKIHYGNAYIYGNNINNPFIQTFTFTLNTVKPLRNRF